MTTKAAAIAEIKTKLATDANFVEQGLVIIFNNQTSDEQAGGYTKHLNGCGFSGLDAEFLSSMALRVVRGQHLTEKQLPWAFKKMPKYAKQVFESLGEQAG